MENLENFEKLILDSIRSFHPSGELNSGDIEYIKQLLETYRTILEIKAWKKDGTQKQ